MVFTDGTYIARLKLNHLDQPYAAGSIVPGSAFVDDDQIIEYVRRGWIDVDSSGGATNGPSLLHPTLSFTFEDAAALKDGMVLFTPKVGDILKEVWVEVTTAFNGTTPTADVGTFAGDTNFGLFGGYAEGLVGLTVSEDDGYSGTGLLTGGPPVLRSAGNRPVPARFVATNPLKVVATQDGTTDGDPLDSTTGVAIAHALILRG